MPMAMRNMEMAPVHVQEIIKRRFEYLELPRIGFHGNWAYPVLQCNIAAVQKGGKGVPICNCWTLFHSHCHS